VAGETETTEIGSMQAMVRDWHIFEIQPEQMKLCVLSFHPSHSAVKVVVVQVQQSAVREQQSSENQSSSSSSSMIGFSVRKIRGTGEVKRTNSLIELPRNIK
jgi:hypothetical protein